MSNKKSNVNTPQITIGQTLRVLSVDPGMANSAVFVANVTKTESGVTVKYIASFMMTVTLREVTDESMIAFVKYCKKLRKLYKPDLFIVERFVPRGGFLPGNIVELVNQMIMAMRMTLNCKSHLITAASWKNSYKKVDLKSVYKVHAKTLGPHRTDAALMCLKQFGFRVEKTNKFLFWLARKSGNLVKK